MPSNRPAGLLNSAQLTVTSRRLCVDVSWMVFHELFTITERNVKVFVPRKLSDGMRLLIMWLGNYYVIRYVISQVFHELLDYLYGEEYKRICSAKKIIYMSDGTSL